MARPGRLKGFDYLGPYRYLLTLCTRNRRQHFANGQVLELVLRQIQRTADEHRFAIIAYCFMPDHVHMLAEGTDNASDLRRFVALSKQRSGYRFAKAHGEGLWQDSYHDRVLRHEEATLQVVNYILENPIRAGLATTYDAYPYSGSCIMRLSDLLSQG